MTTIVYKKWKYIAADKRWIWGEAGWVDTGKKIFQHDSDWYTVYLLNSWIKQMPEKIESLLSTYFWKTFDPVDLFLLQEDLKVIQQWHDFACLVVYVQHQWTNMDISIDPNLRKNNNPIIKDRAWKLWKQACEEIDFHYAAGWSWSDWVDGIMLIKPDIEPKELFELVASRDLYTSPTFDIINLKQ